LVASLSTMQTLQVHVPSAFVGTLSPAAAQLTPADGTTGGLGSSGAAVEPSAGALAVLGLGSSQEAHFVLAPSLSTMQTLQLHVPGAFVGTLRPAAAQLNPPDGTTGGLGLGSCSGTAVEAGAAALGRGSSQEAHFVLVASLSTMQTLHDHVPGAFVGILSPAAAQLKLPVGAAGLGGLGTEAGFVPNVNVNVGREDDTAAKAVLRSLASFKGYGGPVGTLKENDGRDAVSMRRVACFGSLGADFIGCGSVLGPASGTGLGTATLGAKGVGRLGIAGGFRSNSDVTGTGD